MGGRVDRPGWLGWVVVAVTVVVLAITVVVTLDLVSRETLEPMPAKTLDSF